MTTSTCSEVATMIFFERLHLVHILKLCIDIEWILYVCSSWTSRVYCLLSLYEKRKPMWHVPPPAGNVDHHDCDLYGRSLVERTEHTTYKVSF